jgi:hypothetical protein
MKTLTRTLLCAWVLWALAPGPGAQYQATEAYTTKADCLTERARATGSLDSGIVWRDKEKGILALALKCLPDTVRP